MQLINPLSQTQLLVTLASLTMVMAQETAPSSSLDAASIVFGVIFLISGLFFLLSGKRLLKLIVFLAGAFLFAYLTFLSANAIITWSTATSGQKLAVYICMGILGFIGGSMATCIWQLGLVILGGLFGSVLGSMLIRTNIISSDSGQTLIVVGFAVVFAILTFIFHNTLYILATSVIGGFLFMAGIDCFARTGFLDFIDNLGKAGAAHEPITAAIWAMLASVFILAAIGSVIQFKTK